MSNNTTKLIDFHLHKRINLMRFIIPEISAQVMSTYDLLLTKLLKHIKTPSMMYINSKNIPYQTINSLTPTVPRIDAISCTPWLSFNMLKV